MLLMPRSGGAIQAATLPGSRTGFMSDATNAWSSRDGIQPGRDAANSSAEIGRPEGSVGTFAQLPTVRRKRALGRRSSKSNPEDAIVLFQRFVPFSQSRTYAFR